MGKLEYEVKISEFGRPYIDLPENHENNPDDKFCIIELTRTFLTSFNNRRRSDVDDNTGIIIDTTIKFLGQIGDEMASIIYHNMIAHGELDRMINPKKYYGVVQSKDELYSMNEYLCYDSKLYKIEEGLCVLIEKDVNNFETDTIYKYNGIDWVSIEVLI